MTQTKQTTDAIRSERKVSLESRVLKDDELDAVSAAQSSGDRDPAQMFQRVLQQLMQSQG